MTSSVPSARTFRAENQMAAQAKHPLFRRAAVQSHSFLIPAGETVAVGAYAAESAGLYSALITESANSSAQTNSFCLFRLDDQGTITIVQDASGNFNSTLAEPDKLSFAVDTGAFRVSNQFTDSGDVRVTFARWTTE